jgi:hypothetical protein
MNKGGFSGANLTWNAQRITELLAASAGIPFPGDLPEMIVTVNGLPVDMAAFADKMSTWLINVGERNFAYGQRDARDQVVKAITEAIKINIRLDE